MKRTTIFKSLLIAIAMLTGSNAWAQTTTLLEYGTTNVAWSATNLAEWTAGGNPAISSDGSYVEIAGENGSYSTSKTITPTANAIINVSAVWRGRSNTGRAFSAGNGSYFRFGNIIVAQNDQDKKHGYGFAGLSNISGVTTFSAGSYRTDITNCTWLLIEMEINTASNTVTSFSIKSEDGNTTYAEANNIVLTGADYTTVAFGYQKSGSVSTTNTEDLKSIIITQTVQSVQTATYTVKYVCEDVEVKEAAKRNGVVGQDIVLNSSDTQNFYANDKKYIFVSSDVEGKTVSEGAVVTITFREAEKYAWTANSNVGTYTTSGETFEGDKASVTYPLYQLVDGKLWIKGATNSTFAQDFDVTENNEVLTLEYTETDIDNVVFYAEIEDIDGMGVVNTGNAAARSSQRAAGYSSKGTALITTLPQGKYNITARFYSPTSAGGTYNFFTGARNIWKATTVNSNATDLNTEVVLAKESNDIMIGQTGYTAAVDFIYIQSLDDPTDDELAAAQEADQEATPKATIGSTGFATYSNADFSLDFTGLDVKAYTASLTEENTILLTPIEKVPAGTGVMLKGKDSYDIPVIASATFSGTNLFVASTGEEVAASVEGKYHYALANGNNGVGFYNMESARTIAAGKAYIESATPLADAQESRVNWIFADEGIVNAIEKINVESAGNEVYNLKGQRVAAPQKGLYIVNGKKVVVK